MSHDLPEPMSSGSNSFLRFLGVEREEAPLVFPLLLHNFLQGLGIAFLFTTSSAIFIHEFEGRELALAFVIAGVVMMAVARVYAYFEHKMALDRYLPAVVLALPIILVGLRVAGYGLGHGIFAFAMLVAYRVVYMLANLEFWGLTSLVFHIRQSKRLFGLIGSGDIPAKMLGYLAVYLIADNLHLEDLLYLGAAFFLMSWLMLRLVLRNPQAQARLHHHGHHHASHGGSSPDQFLRRFFGNEFVMALALFAAMSSLAMGLVDFSFYGKVKHQYHSSEQLAAFLGLFMTISMAITFALKLLFSGKILQRIGVTPIMALLPALLIIPSVFLLLPLSFTHEQRILLWFFSIMYLVRDVSKYALVDPMFLALFQPLNSHLRLRGHTIVKGLVDPLGLAVIGALIYWGESVAEENMFQLLAGALAVICLGWFVVVRRLGREWLELLQTSVRKRFLDGNTVSLGGKATSVFLHEKLKSGSESEAIYALRMLRENPAEDMEAVFGAALQNSHPVVQHLGLQEMDAAGMLVQTGLLEQMIASDYPPLQTLAARILLRTQPGYSGVAALISDGSQATKAGAIAGMLQSDDPAAQGVATQHLEALVDSTQPDHQLLGLWLIKEAMPSGQLPVVMRLLESDSAAVVDGAIAAAGTIGNAAFIQPLMALAQQPHFRASALEALARYPAEAVTTEAAASVSMIRTLCRLAGRADSQISNEFLVQQIGSKDPVTRREAIHALSRRDFKAAPNDRLVQAHIADMQAQLHTEMAQYQVFLVDPHYRDIATALETELHALVDQLLLCLTFRYDTRTIMRARHGLQFKNAEMRAGALEILDHLLPRGQAARLLKLLEVLYLHRTAETSPKAGSKEAQESCRKLMQEATAVHDSWTVCLATHHFLQQVPGNATPDLVQHAVSGATPFLAQYARWLSTHHPDLIPASPEMHSSHENHASFSPLEMVLMLKASAIFAETPENTLAEVAAIAVVERVAEGEVLFRKGDTGDCMYIIAEGEIHIGDGATRFATMGKGDFFGELALVETEPRSADAVAGSDCLLIRIDQDDFYELIEDRMEVARGILVILAKRLRRQNELIRSLKEGRG